MDRELVARLPAAAIQRGLNVSILKIGGAPRPARLVRPATKLGHFAVKALTRWPDVLYASGTVPPWKGSPVRVAPYYDTVGLHFEDEEPLPSWMADVLDSARLVVTLSETARRDIHEGLGISADKIRVIYPGVDPRRFHPGGEDRDGVLVVGGRTRRKNLKTLLEAWAVAGPELGARLRVVGPIGPPTDHVQWMGYLTDDTLQRLYRSSVLVAVPSLHEGFGLPIVEGMASGTPVVASNASSLPEVAGGAAVLVPPLDVAAWARELVRTYRSHERRAELSSAGLERARQFTWEETASSLASVFAEALS